MALKDIRIPNAAADVVAVFDDDFNQVFQNARAIKVETNIFAKMAEHPRENGSTMTDNQVEQPIEIQMSLILTGDYRSTYQQIKQLYQTATLLTVQTKADSFQNMLISDMPIVEDPATFTVLPMGLKMKEAILVEAQYGTLPPKKVADKTNASTNQKGEQQTQPTPSIARSVYDSIAGVFQ